MDSNTVVQLGLAVLTLVNGWVIYAVRANGDGMKELRRADTEFAAQLGSVRELVAGSYLKRDEFQSSMSAQTRTLIDGLARLETKIDQKADK